MGSNTSDVCGEHVESDLPIATKLNGSAIERADPSGTKRAGDALHRCKRLATALALALFVAACGGSAGGAGSNASMDYGLEINSAAPLFVSLDSEGTLSTGSESFSVTNTRRDETRRFEITSQVNWAQVISPAEIVLDPGESSDVTIAYNGVSLSALGAGAHSGKVLIRDLSALGLAPLENTISSTVEEQRMGPARVTTGLLALYDFNESSGTLVHDTSGVGVPLDLQIHTPDTVVWQPGVLILEGESNISSVTAASKIISACKQTDEITIEAWLTPEVVAQSGPARIVSISNGAYDRNITVGHGGSGSETSTGYNIRTRTSTGTVNGLPALLTGPDEVLPGLQHVVYTRRADGVATVYVNGSVVTSANGSGDFSNWSNSFQLALGNEIGASRAWFGKLHLVAVYDRALLRAEVTQNLVAGSQDQPFGSIIVSPASDFVAFGMTGDDFTGASKTYKITNPGNEPITWQVTSSRYWTYVEGSDTGILPAGRSVDVRLRLAVPSSSSMTAGTFTTDIEWLNLTNGYGDTMLRSQLILSDPGNATGKPGPGNTGPSNPTILTPSGSITANVDGQVIQNVSINGTITIAANNVTIRNFRINGQNASYGIATGLGAYSGTVIEDGEIYNVNSACLFGKNFTARRLNIHESGGDGIKARHNVLVEDCWIHHVGTNPGAHADGDQTREGHNLVFRHNNFDMPIPESPNGQGGYRSNAAFIIQDELGSIDNFLIEDNWLNGGNYTLMLANEGGGPTNLRFINNRFGRDYRYGTLTTDGLSYFASGNVWDDTGLPMSWNNH